MHLDHGSLPTAYIRHTKKKCAIIILGILLLFLLFLYSIAAGAVSIPVSDVIKAMIGAEVSTKYDIIIRNIRLPQALTAIVAGAGLAAAGVVMQSILRNPLGSPFTLGISHAAAFGAAFSVIVLGSGTMQSTQAQAVSITSPLTTTMMAFLFSMIATACILLISRLKRASPEVMILAGVAIGSLFTAGTMFLQYFADDTQLAAALFWTFGDVGRADWEELGLITLVVLLTGIYFYWHRWDYNAIDTGDETAATLGVHVQRLRLVGMILASSVTAFIIAFLGVIGFVGLVGPHMARRVIGEDHRFLFPATVVTGAILLLASDTIARLILAPHVLPVAIITAFLGAPVFLILLIRGYS